MQMCGLKAKVGAESLSVEWLGFCIKANSECSFAPMDSFLSFFPHPVGKKTWWKNVHKHNDTCHGNANATNSSEANVNHLRLTENYNTNPTKNVIQNVCLYGIEASPFGTQRKCMSACFFSFFQNQYSSIDCYYLLNGLNSHMLNAQRTIFLYIQVRFYFVFSTQSFVSALFVIDFAFETASAR